MAVINIPDLAAAAALIGTDLVPVTQGTAVPVKATLSAFAAYVGGSYQPLDSDLTAIAALTTTAFGRGLLALADAAALRTASGAEALGLLAGVNTQTASYTLIATDIGKAVEMNVAGANTLTVPPNSSVAFAIGSRIDLAQIGAGQTTVTPGAGVTIRQRETKLKLAGQYAGASLYKRGTDEWMLFGDLSA